MSPIHTQALKDALQRTRALVSVSDEVLDEMRKLVETGADLELLHVNPVRFAQQRGFDKQQAVTAFVGAAKAGAFEFTWSMTCPLCGTYAHHEEALSNLCGDFYCSICDQTSPARMDTLVEVAFSVHASVRATPQKFDLPLSGPEWFGTFKNPSVKLDPAVEAMVERHRLWTGMLPAGAEEKVAVQLQPRSTRVAAITHNTRATLVCPPGHAGAVVELHEKKLELLHYTKEPGILIRNRSTREAVCDVSVDIRADDFSEKPAAAQFEGFLSGRDLLCNQAFRDLFASETLSAGIAVHVEAQSVLFTDLKGSTQLYDSIGDLRAFALVSEHFKILLSVVQQCGGAVVKTIGDAVMATFPETSDAVRAALQMSQTLERFNASSGLPPLSLKIGVHVGPCIVVNSNGRPDYFGQTVNIAARVQALAEGDELVLTDAARGARGVSSQLEQQMLIGVVSEAALKGVAEKVKVHTVRLATH